jgi:hypothetical protein
MNARDLGKLEELAKIVFVENPSASAKELARQVMLLVRPMAEEHASFRLRIDEYEKDRPTSPDLKIVEDLTRAPCGSCGGRYFRNGDCVTCVPADP